MTESVFRFFHPTARHLKIWALVACIALLISAFTLPANAQRQVLAETVNGEQAGGETQGSLNGFLEQARKDGSTVIIIKPTEEAASTEMPMSMSGSQLLEARAKFRNMLMNSATFISRVDDILKESSPNGTLDWLLIAAATAIGGLMVGYFVFRACSQWMRRLFASSYNPNETKRGRKVGYLLGRAGSMAISTAIMFGVAILVAVIFDTGHEPTRLTIWRIITAYTVYRVLRYVIFFNFFAPDTPSHRLINLSDEEAGRLYRDWSLVFLVGVFIISFCRWMQQLGLSDDAHRLAFIIGMFVCAVMFAILAISHRRELFKIVLGVHQSGKTPAWRLLVAKSVLPAILIYLAFAWFQSSIRLTLGLEGGYVLVAAPIIVFVPAIFVYGVVILIIELIYERRAHRFRRERVLQALKESRQARMDDKKAREAAAAANEDDDLLSDHEEMIIYKSDRDRDDPKPYNPIFKVFFEQAVLATILVVSVGELARLWGLELGRTGGHPFAAALDILLVGFIAFLMYRAVNFYIDAKIVEEGGSLDSTPANPGEGDSEGGVGQSRLATLLPIFRNVIIITLAIVAGMIILANLGVDVGPLFAGAGVVGLAIGFGAQTLIRDIFSGAFFLVDDAFRKGEYIEVGAIKGVVEKISIRSFQLRHHLGALHTVPFGEIHQLTNYSRDWVMMKLPLRVTYDTDVEKVRKLIKKLGQELLQDQTIGSLFIQPLKSQGVYSMEDSAMIIRVKFMTKPGDQFVTRKVVYAAVRKLFEAEGIKFAHREVTVRLADGKKAEELSDAEKEAVAGSVRSAIDGPEAQKQNQTTR